LSTVFPQLQQLTLEGISLTGIVLGSLAACAHVARLQLRVKGTGGAPFSAPDPADRHTSPLAALHSLRDLSTQQVDSTLLYGVTQLTRLHFETDSEFPPRLFPSLDGMSQLVHLHWSGACIEYHGNSMFYTRMVEQICAACPQLRSLELMCLVQQAEFNFLLESQLTSFTCKWLNLVSDVSQTACQLKELRVAGQNQDLQHLAYLPLKSLERVRFVDLKLPAASPRLIIRCHYV
jgi:hypothetical protein